AEPAWHGLRVFAPHPGEGVQAAWHRTLDAVAPAAVWVQSLAGAHPGMLLDLRERGIPYAVFLHDFTPLCPTQRLWHRRQERCSGPGRTGWKCAWCTGGAGGVGSWAGLPLRWLAFRQRPQAWRTALLRAEVLIAPSRFAREFWVAQGAPPERIAVIPPLTTALLPSPTTAPPARAPQTDPPAVIYYGGWDEASGSELLGAALDNIRRPLRVLAPAVSPAAPGADDGADQRLRAAIASRHQLVRAGDGAANSVVVVPTRWEVPFSREVLAAQAAGQRVVATAMGGLTEQILHGVNGYLATPDDPVALAESILEALEALEAGADGAAAWGGALVARHAGAEAAAATARLHRLLTLLTEGEPEIALQLEHHAWLAGLNNGRGLEENTEALITALRLAGIDAAPTRDDQDFARRAEVVSRRWRLDLNHAIAFFRGCGCFRIARLPTAPADDEAAYFQAWGLELVQAEVLPNGVFEDRREGEGIDPGWLRRRFPQARAYVALTPAGLETTAWD
ncbi:MAG TPA: glycosyltransferase, partial [Terriglobales bacterium]